MKFNREKFVADLLSLTERVPPVRWLHQGRDPETGLDCIGMIRWAILRQGYELPAELEAEFVKPYHMIFDGWHLLGVMRRWLPEIEPSKIIAGDIMLFYRKRNPQHVAVFLPDGQVVEAVVYRHANVSGVLKQPIDPTRVLCAVFRIPEEWTGPIIA